MQSVCQVVVAVLSVQTLGLFVLTISEVRTDCKMLILLSNSSICPNCPIL